jgi:hypothetical protein
MIVYSVAAGSVSIAAMFLAGILPGVLVGLASWSRRRSEHPSRVRPNGAGRGGRTGESAAGRLARDFRVCFW